jgi:phenylacetate-CoA ligase
VISIFPTRSELDALQLRRVRELLQGILPVNRFYSRKLHALDLTALPDNLAAFTRAIPLTNKAEIVDDQTTHPPFGTNLTFPVQHYTRFHQTSGTTGQPLRWLDTPSSWQALLEGWIEVYHAAGVRPADRALFAFSFGPFIGFWMAFEAAAQLGCLCLPAGGLTSAARLRMIFDNQITILCCTPTYAARLAEVAAEENIDLSHSPVRLILVAGEPGGSIPAVRARIERLWPGAALFDHHGMTEVGPVTFQCPAQPGRLHVIESAFLPEIIDPRTTHPAAPCDSGELVLTTLTRTASPLLRYRTGDLVKPLLRDTPCSCGRADLALEGGILGRTDDMLIIRGVNLHPMAVETILRSFPEIAEFQAIIGNAHHLDELRLRIEPIPDCADPDKTVRDLQRALQNAFALRIPVDHVPPRTLPRFEMKARRWIRSIPPEDRQPLPSPPPSPRA